MDLLLIRHGQSANNVREGAADYARQRHPDPPLTALGHRQAQGVAAALAGGIAGKPVTRLCSSLTLRAVQTAAPVAAALGLPVQGMALAYECGGLTTGPAGGFAPVAGREYAALRAECPGLLWPAELQGHGWHGGAEPWEAAAFACRAAQVAGFLRSTAHEDGDSVTVLVTHHDFAQFLLAELLGLTQPSLTAPTFRLGNASLSLLEVWPTGGTLRWLNRVDHLLPAEQTY